MKRFFDLKIKTVDGELSNRKHFGLKVSGISIIMTFPKLVSKIICSERFHPNSPRWKIGLARKSPFAKIQLTNIADCIRGKYFWELGSSFRALSNVVNRIKMRLVGSVSSFKENDSLPVTRLLMLLFSGIKGTLDVTSKQTMRLFAYHFNRIHEWDYIDASGDLTDNNNMHTLGEMDYIDLNGDLSDPNNHKHLIDIDIKQL